MGDEDVIRTFDRKHNFVELFDPNTGFYVRSGIIVDGKDTGVDQFMRSMPNLLDVGISGFCENARSGLCLKAGVQCYQGGITREQPHMTLDNFKKIVDEVKGKVFQCLDAHEMVIVQKQGCAIPTKLSDVCVGDHVYDGQQYVTVTGKQERPERRLYEITVDGRRKIRATKDHKFPITRDGERMLVQVSDMQAGDTLDFNESAYGGREETIDLVQAIIQRGLADRFYLGGVNEGLQRLGVRGRFPKSHRIDRVAHLLDKLDYADAVITVERSQYRIPAVLKITPELMRLLGYYVGNGSKRSYVFGKYKEDMLRDVAHCLRSCFPGFSFAERTPKNATVVELNSTILNNRVFAALLGCKDGADKTIPDVVFNVSSDLAKEFLTGYFCDGNIRMVTKPYRAVNITFNTSSEVLYRRLGLLLNKLGVRYGVFHQGGSISHYAAENRFIVRKARFRVIVSYKHDVLKLAQVMRFHPSAAIAADILPKIDDVNSRSYIKGRVVDVAVLTGNFRVVDINVASGSHLFVTSHGVVSHNCALGGHGDPNLHPDFRQILQYCRDNYIVPNYTTSGIGLTDEMVSVTKSLCGAVACSWYRNDLTAKAIDSFLKVGMKTNIHYVLGNNSIDEAIRRLRNKSFPEGINAIIFLLHKPVGLGREDNVLKADDPRVKEFFELVNSEEFPHKIGFDSCSVQGILNFAPGIDRDSIDTCEGARFSAYISSDLKMLPCSFDQAHRWAYDISNDTIHNAWNSPQFEDFRNRMRNACPGCTEQRQCLGGCPIKPQVVLCNRKEREVDES
jgi:radical SAM protein with 4Fe4S-binding SPASM domain